MPERRLQRTRQAYALDAATQMMLESNRAATVTGAYNRPYRLALREVIGEMQRGDVPIWPDHQRTGEETT